MRTTMNIDDDLYRRAKALAALRGCTVTSVVEDALRSALAEMDAPMEFRGLPVSGQPGRPLPGVDLHDSRSLQALLDQGIPGHALR